MQNILLISIQNTQLNDAHQGLNSVSLHTITQIKIDMHKIDQIKFRIKPR